MYTDVTRIYISCIQDQRHSIAQIVSKYIYLFLQQDGEGTMSAMVVEKQKLDNKVEQMKEIVQVNTPVVIS